ncbi:redoxin domain-containing protein [Anatilimnocola sp. NA78]|uniref:redoxin domain-containing protein n=1 Tax=Anatilimnocola sp. NA78 TaxID=3415683 RepID=UPI003CE4BF8E
MFQNQPESNETAPRGTWHSWVSVVVAACLLIGALLLGRQLRARMSPPGEEIVVEQTSTAVTNRGEILFQVHCAKCHGPEGRGDAEGAAKMKPPPRDFAARPWRFAPTKESIRNVTLRGIPGTAMPSAQAALSATDLDAVVEHVFQLAHRQPAIARQVTPEQQLLLAAGFSGTDAKRAAPILEVVDAAGKKQRLQDEQGKLVLINFWGTTCEHCVKKLPQLKQLQEQFRERGLAVWNVCADVESATEAQELLDRLAPGTRTLVDESGLANGRFEVQVLPTVWLVDASGKVIARSQGVQDWNRPEMHAVIENWLPAVATGE